MSQVATPPKELKLKPFMYRGFEVAISNHYQRSRRVDTGRRTCFASLDSQVKFRSEFRAGSVESLKKALKRLQADIDTYRTSHG